MTEEEHRGDKKNKKGFRKDELVGRLDKQSQSLS